MVLTKRKNISSNNKRSKKNVKNIKSRHRKMKTRINKMSGGVLTDRDIEEVKNNKIEEIDINGENNSIKPIDDWMKKFVIAFKKNNSLKSLKFSNFIKIDNKLIEALQQNITLKSLKFNNCNIWDTELINLAKVLINNKKLEIFTLTKYYFGNASKVIKALSEALKFNRTLKELDISNIDDKIPNFDIGKEFAEILKNNEGLTKLNLSKNFIDDAGATALAKALETNKILESLDISNNNIGDAGAQAILEALGTNGNSKLTELNISDNEFSNDKLKEINEQITLTRDALLSQYANNPNLVDSKNK